MKFLLSVLTVSFFSAPAFAASPAGTFVLPHEIAFLSYADQAACEADQGRWDGEALCTFDASDDVTVTKDKRGFKIAVNTVTTNAHSCGFEGRAALNRRGELVASAPSDEWDGEKLRKATCRVTVSYQGSDTVSVGTNGKCTSFCGMNASLEIEGAKRK